MTDFAKVREDYISGMTVEACAIKYRLTVTQVREFVRRNKLVTERDTIKANTLQKVMKKHELDVVNELAIINGRDIAISNRLRDLIAKELDSELDINQLATIARMHKDVQHVARIALDANSEAIRTELMSKKDTREYTDDELYRRYQEIQELKGEMGVK